MWLVILVALVALHVSSVALLAMALGARPSRVRVGYGPALISRTVGGIRLELGLLPLGGFVQFGDAGETYEALSPARRMLISLAGPLALIMLGVLLGNTQFAATFVKLFDGALHPMHEGARLVGRLVTLLDEKPLEAFGWLAFVFAAFNLLPIPPLAGSQFLEAFASLVAGRKVALPNWARLAGPLVMLAFTASWLVAIFNRR